MLNTMKLATLLALYFFFLQPPIFGQDTSRLKISDWQSLFPLRQGLFVTQSEQKIFYIASQSIISIDKSDFSIEQFDKTQGLSDVKLKFLLFNKGKKELIIAYTDGVLDIMDQNGKVISLPQIRNFKNFTGDKSINQLFLVSPDMLLLATQYGISAINMKNREFSFSVFTGLPVRNVIAFKGSYYAATEKGLFKIDANHANPENFNNWRLLHSADGIPFGPGTALGVHKDFLYFNAGKNLYRYTGDNQPAVLVYTHSHGNLLYLNGEGPQLLAGYRCSDFLCNQDEVFIIQEGKSPARIPGNCIGRVQNIIQEENGRVWFGDEYQDFRYLDKITDAQCKRFSLNSPFSSLTRWLTISPEGVLWLASGGVTQNFGYRFLDHGFASLKQGNWRIYNRFNTPAMLGENINSPDDDLYDIVTVAVHPTNGKVYAGSFLEGLLQLDGEKMVRFDEKNSSLNNTVGDAIRTRVSGLAFDKDKNLWIANHLAEKPISVFTDKGEWQSFKPGCAETQLHQIGIDGSGFKWFVSSSSSNGALVFDAGDLKNPSDDRCRLLNTNTSRLPTNQVNCLTVDREGYVWLGTTRGIVIFECGGNIFDTNCKGELRIVEQDGFLDYLLATEEILSMAVDGGNRKWIGTKNGLFILSADGRKTLERFNTLNSPLPGNSVQAIALDPKSGKAYIGTENGLVVFQSEAIEAKIFHVGKKIEIFPNPVPPSFSGPIAIRGLARDAVVQISDINGKLVYETRAVGGQALWYGKDFQQNFVKTGVYLVFSTSNPGLIGFSNPDTAVGKIVWIGREE
jgi:hypothetical protein